MKVFIISLGCAKNKVDSEVIIGNLIANDNIFLTDDIKLADLIIINTCAFIESAKTEAINTIFEVIDSKKKKQKVMVCGCLSTRYINEIHSLIPEVDRFVSIKEYPNLKEIINNLFKEHPFSVEVSSLNRLVTGLIETPYVKISEGCNNRCSYCAIPLIRGKFISREKEEIIDEVKKLILNGAKEINLISQDTTYYGRDIYKDYKLVNLLGDLCSLDGEFKIRLLYLYPNLVDDELIAFIRDNEKMMPYFDIPLQHSEDKMLIAMNRRGDKKFITELIEKIRKEIPHAILRTTMIVGYPGEDEEDFNSLLKFIKDYPFDRLGAFVYSPEEGTKGYSLPQISDDIKNRRLEMLYLVQDEVALEQNKKQIGTIVDAIVVDYDPDSYAYIGRSYAFAPDDVDGFIYIYSMEELKIGQVVKIKILDASPNTLEAQVI